MKRRIADIFRELFPKKADASRFSFWKTLKSVPGLLVLGTTVFGPIPVAVFGQVFSPWGWWIVGGGLCAILLCFLWFLAIAVDRTRPPRLILPNTLDFDSSASIWELRVEIEGPEQKQVTPRVAVLEVKTPDGERNPNYSDEIEVHWRGKTHGARFH